MNKLDINNNTITNFNQFCIEKHWQFDNENTEATFQFRFGWFLYNHLQNEYDIDFEKNIGKKTNFAKHIKKEIDILLINNKKKKLQLN